MSNGIRAWGKCNKHEHTRIFDTSNYTQHVQNIILITEKYNEINQNCKPRSKINFQKCLNKLQYKVYNIEGLQKYPKTFPVDNDQMPEMHINGVPSFLRALRQQENLWHE